MAANSIMCSFELRNELESSINASSTSVRFRFDKNDLHEIPPSYPRAVPVSLGNTTNTVDELSGTPTQPGLVPTGASVPVITNNMQKVASRGTYNQRCSDFKTEQTLLTSARRLATSLDSPFDSKDHSFELISRGARLWQKHEKLGFHPWDFSQISSAALTLARGSASAERPAREGVCGSYFIRGESEILGIFKPADEEAGNSDVEDRVAESGSNHLDDLFHPGGGAAREVAAYLLDHDNFARVPQTALAKVDISLPDKQCVVSRSERPKDGAFQVYVSNLGDADDFGPGVFITEDVHRIAVLDIRTLNCDRHGGNLLVVPSNSGSYGLIPIDHGYILPDRLPTCPWPVWMDWKQAKVPVSEQTRRYVDLIDASMDSRIIKEELQGGIGSRALAWLKISTFLLKRGVQLGMSLYDIGCLIFSRNPNEETSELSKIVSEALDAARIRERRIFSDESTSSSPEKEFSLSRGNSEEIFKFDDDLAHEPGSRLRAEKQLCLDPFGHEWHDVIWDYVVKYACRRIDERLQVYLEGGDRKSLSKRTLSRVRSIPEFAIASPGKSQTIDSERMEHCNYFKSATCSPTRFHADSSPLSMKSISGCSDYEKKGCIRRLELSESESQEVQLRMHTNFQKLPDLNNSLLTLFGSDAGAELNKSMMTSPLSSNDQSSHHGEACFIEYQQS
uniref:PI3K/PI4K catalytic domain-containing protein n=1 Tax=Timspurckia oligopyrenoides TaxID=708627 RepID=A0A7S1EPB5_9RHOD|mmetsp:Transcript_10299/g.18560  ORF Transcript_10299/g.18560 Transcript_10299/m.18560 type:complete len:678 (+) Transcript_10299:678-2711(+)